MTRLQGIHIKTLVPDIHPAGGVCLKREGNRLTTSLPHRLITPPLLFLAAGGMPHLTPRAAAPHHACPSPAAWPVHRASLAISVSVSLLDKSAALPLRLAPKRVVLNPLFISPLSHPMGRDLDQVEVGENRTESKSQASAMSIPADIPAEPEGRQSQLCTSPRRGGKKL